MASPPVVVDKSDAACKYILKASDDLKALNDAVCSGAGAGTGAPIPPVVDPKKKESDALLKKIQGMLDKIKSENTSHPDSAAVIQAFKVDQATATPFEVSIKSKTSNPVMSDGTTIEDIKELIKGDLIDKTTSLKGGRRGKRSVRRNRRSFKGGRGNRSRRSRKGKKGGRRSRGRTIKGGAKMGKELKEWLKRQQRATGVAPISKKTIAATKTKPQATGSAQRSESSKHVAAGVRGLNSSSS